jgi:hypothetical protein
LNNKKYDVDGLLKKALRSTETPDAALVQKVKSNYIKEENLVKKTSSKRPFSAVAAVVAAVILIATPAFAAWYFLKPSDVAEKADNYALSAAFESKTAVNINQSVISGDYIFTLLAVVSGKDITDMPYYDESRVQMGRTYAVVAIRHTDESPMPAASDTTYGKTPFFASPLVKGLKPWEINAVTLNGGYFETVVDGVMYRLVECDDISVFADRGIYFAICDSAFINNATFKFNEKTGEISVNLAYQGASAVFDLPLDKKLANHIKAAEILNGLQNTQNTSTNSNNDEPAPPKVNVNWDNAKVVEWSKTTLKVDSEGYFRYDWDSDGKTNYDIGSGSITAKVTDVFTSDNMNTAIANVMAADETVYALRVVKSADGTLTGMIVVAQ